MDAKLVTLITQISPIKIIRNTNGSKKQRHLADTAAVVLEIGPKNVHEQKRSAHLFDWVAAVLHHLILQLLFHFSYYGCVFVACAYVHTQSSVSFCVPNQSAKIKHGAEGETCCFLGTYCFVDLKESVWDWVWVSASSEQVSDR